MGFTVILPFYFVYYLRSGHSMHLNLLFAFANICLLSSRNCSAIEAFARWTLNQRAAVVLMSHGKQDFIFVVSHESVSMSIISVLTSFLATSIMFSIDNHHVMHTLLNSRTQDFRGSDTRASSLYEVRCVL